MGNTFGSKKTIKVMKVTGETMKLKAPVEAGDVLKDYPGFVLLESESVKHYGVRAKPLERDQKLSPRRLYFLVELPKVAREQVPRRVRSAINMSAKDRLESLMLSRRSSSDLSLMKSGGGLAEETAEGGGARVKVRLPKAEVERLLKESRDEAEAAERIMGLYMERRRQGVCENAQEKDEKSWKANNGGIKAREKRVSFMPIMEAEIQIAVAS